VLKIVAYDLHFGTEEIYKELISTIKLVADDSIEIEKSVWIVDSDDDCEMLRDMLDLKLRDGDKLFVAPLPRGSYWTVGIKGLKQFLANHR
jgi:hypothetical protein